MRFGLTRRKLIGRAFSTTCVATVATSAVIGGRSEAGAQSSPPELKDAPQLASQWARFRQIVDRIDSSAGASIVGFVRRESGAVPGTVQKKLLEFPSITDFGAVGDDRTDNARAMQRAIDALYDGGGGSLSIPAGTFRIERRIQLRSNVKLQGAGPASVLHLVNNSRSDALRGAGDRSSRLSAIAIRDLTVAGDARFSGGVPSVINGNGIVLVNADDCDISGVAVIGFSDGGILFLDGSRNCVMNCRVQQTAQGISFTASDMTVTGNIAVGNRIADTGEYNGLHLEGGFGGRAKGEVRHTTLSGNTISACWEAGINIELAPYTSCIGNTVQQAGLGRTAVNMGIKVYGGYRSAICGNTITDATGDAIVVGANSGECSINGNATAGNGGSLLLTDSEAQVSNDVSISANSFTEGDVRLKGNVSVRNRTMGFDFANRASPDPQTLDWYEEGRFLPLVEGGDVIGIGAYTKQEGLFTRIGNVVHVALSVGWSAHTGAGDIRIKALPYPAAADMPLTAALRFDGAETLTQVVAIVSGTSVKVPMRLLPDGPRRDTQRQMRQVSISGQYLTIG